MQTKTIIISIAVLVIAIAGGFILFSGNNTSDKGISSNDNVSIVDGKQVITINAKGGYAPRITTAKANMPTVIKFNTQNTFDCSSAVTIPSLGYTNNLQPSGDALVDVPPQQAGTSLKGLCTMGMYNFTVNFI